MNLFRISALTASLLGASVLALPSQAEGLFSFEKAEGDIYVSGYGGVTFGKDNQFVGLQAPEAGVPGVAGASATVDVDYSADRTFGGAIGAQLPFKYFFGIIQPRIEVEGSTFQQSVSSGSFNGGSQTFLGDLSGTTILFNNYSDFIFSEDQVIVPYLGGGLGVAFINSDIQYFPGTATAPTFGVIAEDTAFAGHFAGGVTFRFSEKFDLYTEARYTRITGVELERRFVAGGADGFNADVSDRIENITVFGGLRFRF